MTESFNQEKVLAALINDSQTALAELFDHYYPRLYNFSKAFLKFDDGIDDILQEVFLKVWRSRKDIKSSITFKSYIFTITQHLLINELRSRLNNQKMRDRLAKIVIAEEYLSFQQVDYDELKRRIDQAVEVLPEKQKEIFKKSRIEGLSHKEIANELGVTTKTVEYHIGQAIRFLKERLSRDGELTLLYFYLFYKIF
jgi:RNA polymerase sigma-70 factor (ECF subfamily)